MIHDRIFDRGEWRVIVDALDKECQCPVCHRKVEHVGDCPIILLDDGYGGFVQLSLL